MGILGIKNYSDLDPDPGSYKVLSIFFLIDNSRTIAAFL